MIAHVWNTAFALSDWLHLIDGQMVMIHMFTFPVLVTSHTLPVAQPITNHCTAWSGTYYSFTSDESCACFLVNHSYITCLSLPYHLSFTRIQVTPRFQISYICPVSHHIAPLSHCPYLLHHQRWSLTPRLHPQSHIGFTLWLPAPSILATSLVYHQGFLGWFHAPRILVCIPIWKKWSDLTSVEKQILPTHASISSFDIPITIL